MTRAGERFVRALAARDDEDLRALFAPDLHFRGLTPRRAWEAIGAEQALEHLLGRWFEPADVVDTVEHLEVTDVGGRERVDYRFRGHTGEAPFTVEQRAYLDLDASGRVVRMSVLCSGFAPA